MWRSGVCYHKIRDFFWYTSPPLRRHAQRRHRSLALEVKWSCNCAKSSSPRRDVAACLGQWPGVRVWRSDTRLETRQQGAAPTAPLRVASAAEPRMEACCHVRGGAACLGPWPGVPPVAPRRGWARRGGSRIAARRRVAWSCGGVGEGVSGGIVRGCRGGLAYSGQKASGVVLRWGGRGGVRGDSEGMPWEGSRIAARRRVVWSCGGVGEGVSGGIVRGCLGGARG
jgi:hypothetical protein